MGLLLWDLGQGTLLPGASLLQVDKTISEVTEDPFHAPALKGGISPPGTSYYTDCFLRPQVG